MQIQAFKRVDAITVNLFGVDIDFIPNSKGHVVGETDHEAAIDRLLSPEVGVYRKYIPGAQESEPALAPAPAPVAVVKSTAEIETVPEGDVEFDKVLLGAESFTGDTVEIFEGRTIPLPELITSAFNRSGMDREEWNLNDESDRENLIEREVFRLGQLEQKAKDDQAAAAQDAAIAANPYLLKSADGQTVDLAAMSGTQLREFAKSAGVTLPIGKNVKVDTLRDLTIAGIGQKAAP